MLGGGGGVLVSSQVVSLLGAGAAEVGAGAGELETALVLENPTVTELVLGLGAALVE